MSEGRPIAIEARPAPLSHLKDKNVAGSGIDSKVIVMVGLVIVIGVAVFYLGNQSLVLDRAQIKPAAMPGDGRTTSAASDQPLPFAQAQQQLAKERSQKALAKFVEQQIFLESNMAVEHWGQAELAAALSTAEQGDLEFASEQFETAITTYEQAAQQLADLIALGHERVQNLLAEARAAIDQRQPQAASAALSEAKAIQPDHADIERLTQRVEQLPAIIRMFRDAKNHELSARFAEALALYEQIVKLDPETQGVNEAKLAVAEGAARLKLEQTLSRGFALFNSGDFSGARAAFNQALEIDPEDSIARGGLQQVARAHDLAIIAEHRDTAEAAMAAESYATAATAYQAVLALDKNIQFAVSGLRTAQAHERAHKLLTAINAQPNRLSSQALFLQAQEIVNEASLLNQRGDKLNQLIAQTQTLLTQFRDPVEVQLISDNRTNVIVSNVGNLGYFEEKRLSLRPGEYTFRGSQDGCRDVYLSVLIVPGIDPIDLRCQDRL